MVNVVLVVLGRLITIMLVLVAVTTQLVSSEIYGLLVFSVTRASQINGWV